MIQPWKFWSYLQAIIKNGMSWALSWGTCTCVCKAVFNRPFSEERTLSGKITCIGDALNCKCYYKKVQYCSIKVTKNLNLKEPSHSSGQATQIWSNLEPLATIFAAIWLKGKLWWDIIGDWCGGCTLFSLLHLFLFLSSLFSFIECGILTKNSAL